MGIRNTEGDELEDPDAGQLFRRWLRVRKAFVGLRVGEGLVELIWCSRKVSGHPVLLSCKGVGQLCNLHNLRFAMVESFQMHELVGMLHACHVAFALQRQPQMGRQKKERCMHACSLRHMPCATSLRLCCTSGGAA